LALAAAAAATAGVGAVGGLGGAVLLVPVLVVTGTPVAEAAPLGLVSVAAGSLAAGAGHLEDRVVHHRLGIALEIVASAGAVVGVLAADQFGDAGLTRMLGIVALVAAVAGGTRTGLRNLPDPTLESDAVGERVGSLAGAYRLGDGVVPYEARRLPVGLALMAVAGVVAGLSGTSGGFIKTPTMSEVMHVPVKVAAATTTFTVGVTAAAGLLVMAAQDRIDVRDAAIVVAAAIVGGRAGVELQRRLSPVRTRRVLSALLVAVGVVLLVTA
jgi:uncharacterized membrane protein YfcA